MIRTWFTADTHFFHKKICEYSNRPFASMDEMVEAIVDRWNATVGKQDVVWHLGDFAFSGSKDHLDSLFMRLNGQKHLIRGNHDDKRVFRLPWSSQQDYKELKINGTHVALFHFPLATWDRERYGAWNLHGHCHGNLPVYRRRADVGVDVWNMTPVSFEQIISDPRYGLEPQS